MGETTAPLVLDNLVKRMKNDPEGQKILEFDIFIFYIKNNLIIFR